MIFVFATELKLQTQISLELYKRRKNFNVLLSVKRFKINYFSIFSMLLKYQFKVQLVECRTSDRKVAGSMPVLGITSL